MSNTKYLEHLHVSYAVVIAGLFFFVFFWVLPLKGKSITEFSVLISLSCGMLKYKVEKSYFENHMLRRT